MLFHSGPSSITLQEPDMRRNSLLIALVMISATTACAQRSVSVTEWLTTSDRSSLLTEQPKKAIFHSAAGQPQANLIAVDDKQTYQAVDGFGVALTGGSAQLMMAMEKPQRKALLQELFGTGARDIGISYIRVTIGSSDMNQDVYSYDDMPAGQSDSTLSHFSLKPDASTVIPLLKEILTVDPSLKILATPWSAPAWMKTNGDVKGGNLKPGNYRTYARYLVRYLQGMQAAGIPIDAITMQNEPLNPKNTPSMVMMSKEEDQFLKSAFGPLMRSKDIRTKIILFDHNCNHPDYPISILADTQAAQYTVGSGFHLYEGVISALSTVHDAFPAKNLYFTEQMVVDKPGATDLAIAEPLQQVVIAAMRNWSRTVLLWNLAADPQFGPHTSNGGCPVCEGAITLDGSTVQRNLAYYTIAQASKFVRPGSVRVASSPSDPDGLADVAFRALNGHYALIVANSSVEAQSFAIVFHGQEADESLPPGAAATYTWQ
jgi:glucosylceramidase